MPKRAAASSPARDASKKDSSKAAKADGGEEKTPYDLYFEKLQAKRKELDGILGQMLIKGIPRSEGSEEEYEEDDDEEEEDNSKYTTEQMSTLRFVFITQNRSDQLDRMREYILGDQADSNIMMFNTSFSYGVRDGFYDFKSGRYAKAKTPADKFDLLFAYTYQLKDFDVWMHDNEGGMDGMVKELAGMWKRLLKNDDNKLGIDAEFTRPGILQLLEDFKKQIEECYSEPPFQFKYK